MKLISVDLESPLPHLPAPSVGRQWVLVRLHGQPMGILRLDARAYTAAELAELALERALGPIVHHLAGDSGSTGSTGSTGSKGSSLGSALPWRVCPRRVTAGTLSMTVAVCSRNGAQRLPGCLEALGALDYPRERLELLVVDNAPDDEATARLVRERFPGVRYVCEPRPGLDWARNRAIAEAHGDILLMGDADDSYDWSAIEPFVRKVQEGYDLVMGNRFAGGIRPGAMPRLHRYLGNPVLSTVARMMPLVPVDQ